MRLFLFSLFAAAPEPVDLSDGAGFSEQLVHMFLSLAFVLVLLAVGGWILKKVLNQRMVQMNSSSEIKIVERRTLSPKSALYLVEVGEERLLIGETPTGISSLGKLPLKKIEEEV